MLDCHHAIATSKPSTVQCKLGLYGGFPHLGVCKRCPSRNSVTGLGDVVAKVAQPIAKAIDKVAGTNVQGCGGCKARQAKLNALVPFKPAS